MGNENGRSPIDQSQTTGGLTTEQKLALLDSLLAKEAEAKNKQKLQTEVYNWRYNWRAKFFRENGGSYADAPIDADFMRVLNAFFNNDKTKVDGYIAKLKTDNLA